MAGFVPPTAGAFDSPAVCVSLNVEWRSFVVGVLERLLTAPVFGMGNDGVYIRHDEPVWIGDDNAQYLADQQILAIMTALMLGNCEDDMPTGSISAYAGTVAPAGWLLCNGGSHLKSDFPHLWGVLSLNGAIFEEDTDHFIVPDLRGRVIVGAGAGAGLTNRLIGQFDGEETHLLAPDEIPTHTHFLDQYSNQNTQADGFGGGFSYVGQDFVTTDGVHTTPSGGDEPHNNMPPFFVLNFIIKT